MTMMMKMMMTMIMMMIVMTMMIMPIVMLCLTSELSSKQKLSKFCILQSLSCCFHLYEWDDCCHNLILNIRIIVTILIVKMVNITFMFINGASISFTMMATTMVNLIRHAVFIFRIGIIVVQLFSSSISSISQ